MLTFVTNFMFGHVFKFCRDSRMIGSNGFLLSYRNYLHYFIIFMNTKVNEMIMEIVGLDALIGV
jgi:hypothetical protein